MRSPTLARALLFGAFWTGCTAFVVPHRKKISELQLLSTPTQTMLRVPRTQQHESTRLYVSTPEELRLNPKKEPLVNTYDVANRVYTALAVLLFIMPDKTGATRLASKWGGVAGYALAAGSCRMLRGATRAGRLASDTYKRLNIGLMGFCLTFWAMPAEAGFLLELASVKLLTFLLSASKAFGFV